MHQTMLESRSRFSGLFVWKLSFRSERRWSARLSYSLAEVLVRNLHVGFSRTVPRCCRFSQAVPSAGNFERSPEEICEVSLTEESSPILRLGYIAAKSRIAVKRRRSLHQNHTVNVADTARAILSEAHRLKISRERRTPLGQASVRTSGDLYRSDPDEELAVAIRRSAGSST